MVGLALAGCGHHHADVSANASAPPASQPSYGPGPYASGARTAPPRTGSRPAASGDAGNSSTPPSAVSAEDQAFVESHQPILSEEGVASWYGPPYHHRQGANGQIFDQNATTAAHRTLPMGSLIVVTNEKTGQSSTMRVTDRGPFVPGRLLDLSMASAKATGVYLPGTANVRIDVYQAPKPIERGGRWCVQIGAFDHERSAEKLRGQLERKYENANVIDFEGPTGYWVRIRPVGDNREQAELIAKRLNASQGDAYLVRLD
jgi:rare lipoprotein A